MISTQLSAETALSVTESTRVVSEASAQTVLASTTVGVGAGLNAGGAQWGGSDRVRHPTVRARDAC